MSALAALDPSVATELDHLIEGIWDGRIDPGLVERCRERVCVLLGAAPDTARPPGAPDIASPPDARDRAALAFTEQWVLDPHGVTDELAASVRHHLSDAECAAFTIALALLEAQVRAERTLTMLG